MTDDQRLNDLCSRTRNPAALNVLHACRPDHPLGRGDPRKWRTAWGMVQQNTIPFLGADVEWLKRKAEAEAREVI